MVDALESASGPAQEEPKIKLRLSHPHPLISKTTYKSDPTNSSGHSLQNDRDGVDVRVSRPQFRVALAVMDRLLKALEKRDMSIRIEGGYQAPGTYVYTGSYDRCQIWLEEKHRRVDHVLTPKEKAEQARYSFHRAPKWDFVPTGRLILHPGGDVDLSSQQALDDLIDRAVAEIVRSIEKTREDRRLREEAQRREAKRQQRIENERKRVKAFYESADALHRYRRLIEYIEEVRRFGRVPADQLRDGQSFEQWLEWAQAQARAIHPLGD